MDRREEQIMDNEVYLRSNLLEIEDTTMKQANEELYRLTNRNLLD